jgi:hypothetical protein
LRVIGNVWPIPASLLNIYLLSAGNRFLASLELNIDGRAAMCKISRHCPEALKTQLRRKRSRSNGASEKSPITLQISKN